MFITKTWHFLGNFAFHSHVYWAKLISTMQIIVKYARLCKYSWDRNYIKTVERNRTNLDLESKEIKSTWLSNGGNDESPSPSLSEQTDECDKKGRGGCSALTGQTSSTSVTVWRRWTYRRCSGSQCEQTESCPSPL